MKTLWFEKSIQMRQFISVLAHCAKNDQGPRFYEKVERGWWERNLHSCWNSRWCYCWPVVKRLPSKIRGPKGENWDGIACEQPPPPRQRRPLRPPRSANLRRHLLTSEISEREVIKTSSLRKMTHSVGTLGQQRVNATESSLRLNEKMAMGPRTLWYSFSLFYRFPSF